MEVSQWTWRKHISRTSGKEMISVTYYGGLSDTPVTEYLAVTHDGYAGQKARRLLADIAARSGAMLDYKVADMVQIADAMGAGTPPMIVEYRKDGKFFTVIDRSWK
jgi:DNA repair protein RadD